MTTAPLIATMASQALPPPSGGAVVPDWVHLLPAGTARTHDGRGPYRIADAQAVIAASLQDERGLPIDENHATDLAAPQGREAPARGWIVGLEAREDGIWGRVEWTGAGQALLADRAYRGLSPVILHDQAGRVIALRGASLVNRPNLRGLTALHAEGQDMEALVAKLKETLGLAADAPEEDIWRTLSAVMSAATAEKAAGATALQSALGEIGTALGVEADQAQIVAAASAARVGVEQATALQASVTSLQAEVDGLKAEKVRTASEAYVDGEMKKGRAGLNAGTRDTFVSLHMTQPVEAAKIIEAMPILGPGGAQVRGGQPPAGGAVVALNAEQATAARVLGIAPEAYLRTLQAERQLGAVA